MSIACTLPGCDIKFERLRPNKKFCCPEHKREYEQRLYLSKKADFEIISTGRISDVLINRINKRRVYGVKSTGTRD